MLEKQAVKLVQPSKYHFLSILFLVAKKDTGHRPVINFKNLNRYIPLKIWIGTSLTNTSKCKVFFFSKKRRRLHVQDRSEGRLIFSSPSFKFPEIYQVQMERESLSVVMPLLWPKFSSKVIRKTNEDLDFVYVEIECENNNVSRRYFDNGINEEGTNSR